MSKVAFITGATRGIGKSIALKLASCGYDIAINYRTENDDLTELLNEIKGFNVRCIAVCGDVSDFEACTNMIKQIISEFEKIDVLVNNAGITRDMLLMRMTEILLSIPNLLLVIFLQAILGKANVLSLSLVIGVTSWTSIAKVVRTEVRQLRSNEYVVAARCMGGGFFYILRKHLAPNFLSSIMFMVVMNIRSAIVEESTLSFMGIGLPLEIISWGSMLSLSEKALLTDGWWIILIPGAFLVVTLLAITGLGDYLRKELNKKESYL